jgi:Tfp pilus assembly protein PilO
MNKTKQPIIHLIFFVIFLMTAMVVFYLTQNQIRKTSLARAELVQLTESRGRLTELATLLPSYGVLERNWLSTLPQNEKEVAAFAGSLEQLAKVNGLFLELSFDDFPGPVDVSGHYIAGVGAQITLIGNYAGVTNFLSSLTDLPYYFKVDKMTLTKPDNRPGLKAQFNGSLMMNLAI